VLQQHGQRRRPQNGMDDGMDEVYFYGTEELAVVAVCCEPLSPCLQRILQGNLTILSSLWRSHVSKSPDFRGFT
jgi:hypothetical protein